MALSLPSIKTSSVSGRRYLRAPVPLYFPEEEQVPESAVHRERLILLAQLVRHALGERALVSSDQFLYWDPTNPRKCLAPDLAVRVGGPSRLLSTWKTWELGAPHVGVEIVSDWDTSTGRMEEKLERYRQAGIAEVVRFDPEARERSLRLWDLIDGDLVERDPSDPQARHCDALGLYWCVCNSATLGPTLRLARDAEGTDLLPTPEEAAFAAKDAAFAAKEAALAAKDAALADKDAALADKDAALADKDAALADKDAALARVRELEALLAKK